jgi:very-short-patch-repair endonuclease
MNHPSHFEGPSQLSAEDVAKMQVFAQKLRESPRTLAEQVMRVILDTRFREFEFHEQVPLHNRVADFYSRPFNVAVEVDGSYHNSRKRWWVAPDGYKERALRKRGFSMVRFPNADVINAPEWVIDQLFATLPLFTTLIVPDGPCSPVGLTIRLHRSQLSLAEFTLEMESDVQPSLADIVARVTSYRPRQSRRRGTPNQIR